MSSLENILTKGTSPIVFYIHTQSVTYCILRLCVRLGDIGEDLLVDISEVLFNELSYYHLLKEQE